MILITTVAGVIGRFAGRVLNSALGWATVLLFGKVAQSRQILLLLVTLGSLAWAAALAGVLVPSVGTFLLASVPAPDFVEPNWLRLAMLAVAIVLPLGIGVASRFLVEPQHRPAGRAALLGVLRGYPFALLLALTLVLLSAVALSTKVMSLARRWEDAHVPIVLKPGGYDGLIDGLADALEDRLLAAAAGVDGGAGPVAIRQDLAAVDRRLQELAVPFEEWETLYRQRVQIERDLLARDREPAAGRVPASRVGTGPPAGRTAPEAAPAWPDWAAAALGFGLIAVDVGLLLLGRIAPPNRHRGEGRGA